MTTAMDEPRSDKSVEIHYHAGARDLVGMSREELPIETAIEVAAFREWLGKRHPALVPYLPNMRVAINEELRPKAATIQPGDRIDLIPPVAGGSDNPVRIADVRDTPLSIDELFNAVNHSGAGGVVIFTGVVRDNADGKSVARLDYEAQQKMAIAETKRILSEVAKRHSVRIAAVHRVGELKVGDLAVVVAAAGAHRAEAFAACREALDEIKANVPIWKKEWSPEGEAHWVNLER